MQEKTFYLNFAHHTGRVHPTGHVDRVAPDVVLRFLGADDPGHDGPDVDADPDLEVVEGVLVDIVELLADAERVLGHGVHVHVVDCGGLVGKACN